jgi:hypothetical protein
MGWTRRAAKEEGESEVLRKRKSDAPGSISKNFGSSKTPL